MQFEEECLAVLMHLHPMPVGNIHDIDHWRLEQRIGPMSALKCFNFVSLHVVGPRDSAQQDLYELLLAAT